MSRVRMMFDVPARDLYGENQGLDDITQVIQQYTTSDVRIYVNGKKVATP